MKNISTKELEKQPFLLRLKMQHAATNLLNNFHFSPEILLK
jgi:hypothetical protein